jgi:hypothetical protein
MSDRRSVISRSTLGLSGVPTGGRPRLVVGVDVGIEPHSITQGANQAALGKLGGAHGHEVKCFVGGVDDPDGFHCRCLSCVSVLSMSVLYTDIIRIASNSLFI